MEREALVIEPVARAVVQHHVASLLGKEALSVSTAA